MSLAINQKFYVGASKAEILKAINPEEVKQYIRVADDIEGVRDERYQHVQTMTRPCPITGHLPIIIQSWEPILISKEEKNNLNEQ